jgi:hypothetical protein
MNKEGIHSKTNFFYLISLLLFFKNKIGGWKQLGINGPSSTGASLIIQDCNNEGIKIKMKKSIRQKICEGSETEWNISNLTLATFHELIENVKRISLSDCVQNFDNDFLGQRQGWNDSKYILNEIDLVEFLV